MYKNDTLGPKMKYRQANRRRNVNHHCTRYPANYSVFYQIEIFKNVGNNIANCTMHNLTGQPEVKLRMK